MKSNLLIIGASGHGRVIADIARKMNIWKSISFLDDDESKESFMDVDVIGKSYDVGKYIEDCDIVVGVGNNFTREKIMTKLEDLGASMPVLIHPDSTVGGQVEIGPGTVVMAGVTINPSTIIGKGCIVNTGATIDHDNIIGDYVHISPGVNLAGIVNIGKRTWLGIGSIISNNITIIDDCTVGAGAVVVKDIREVGTYVGVPARRL